MSDAPEEIPDSPIPDNTRRVVIKVGGDVLLDEKERTGLARNVRELVDDGWQVVLLHGGGPQVTRLQERLGLSPIKVGGRRVTSPDDLVVVEQAICGEANVQLVSTLIGEGVNAFGCHGASGMLVEARKRPPTVVSGGGPDPVDFGEVGDVVSVHTELLLGLLGLDVVPVIATLGIDEEGRVFNINADTTVVQIAQALQADLLLLVTKVGAIYEDVDDEETRILEITATEARSLILKGVIQGGMIPKVEEALGLLSRGVGTIAIVNASPEGAFRAVAADDDVLGTRIIPD